MALEKRISHAFVILTQCDCLPVWLKLFHVQLLFKFVFVDISVQHHCILVLQITSQRQHGVLFDYLPTVTVCLIGKFHC